MITVLILIPVFGFVLFLFACYKTDWEAIDEQTRHYYIGGIRSYYEGKILIQNKLYN